MTPETKQTTYWTAAVVLASILVLSALGYTLGWYEPLSAAQG